MAQAAVGADLHQPFDVLGALAAQVALDLALIDRVAQANDLVLGQVFDHGVGIDLGLLEDLLGGRAPDPEDVGEADFDALADRDVDSCDTCHAPRPSPDAACVGGSGRSPRPRRCGG